MVRRENHSGCPMVELFVGRLREGDLFDTLTSRGVTGREISQRPVVRVRRWQGESEGLPPGGRSA